MGDRGTTGHRRCRIRRRRGLPARTPATRNALRGGDLHHHDGSARGGSAGGRTVLWERQTAWSEVPRSTTVGETPGGRGGADSRTAGPVAGGVPPQARGRW